MAIHVWLAPRDVCALVATREARARVAAALRAQYAGDPPETLLEAAARFQHFYERTYARCLADQDPEALDQHQLVKVPRDIYRLLQALGFCTFEDARGEARTLHDADGHPVCVLGSFVRSVSNRAALTYNNVKQKGLQTLTNISASRAVAANLKKAKNDHAVQALRNNLQHASSSPALAAAYDATIGRLNDKGAKLGAVAQRRADRTIDKEKHLKDVEIRGLRLEFNGKVDKWYDARVNMLRQYRDGLKKGECTSRKQCFDMFTKPSQELIKKLWKEYAEMKKKTKSTTPPS